MVDLSNHLAAEGQWGEALAAIEEAVTIRRQLAADQPDLAGALSNLAHVLEALGRASEAREAWAEADAIGIVRTV
jgi:tetratricopeptide (TPR) repeat protein